MLTFFRALLSPFSLPAAGLIARLGGAAGEALGEPSDAGGWDGGLGGGLELAGSGPAALASAQPPPPPASASASAAPAPPRPRYPPPAPPSAPPAPSFALECVESALLLATAQLDGALVEASGRVAALLRVLPRRLAITAEILEELRLVKQSLVELDSRAGAIRKLLLEVLDDEEDVAGMQLRGASGAPPRTPQQAEDDEDEVENLLEYYLQRTEGSHGEAERLLANTRDLEESISVSLSARRFEVNKLELSLSIATFATAAGALVAGIFGMNLRNRLEMSTAAFCATAAGIMLGVTVLCIVLFRYTRRKRIL